MSVQAAGDCEGVAFFPASGLAIRHPLARPLLDESLDAEGTVFLIPYGDGFLLYAPLSGLVALTDYRSGSAVRKHYRQAELDAFETKAVSRLRDEGFLLDRAGRTEKARQERRDLEWKPTTVTFSTTQKCTLRCTYCYAEGGRLDDLDIPWPIAQSAIDLAVQNATLAKVSPTVNFIGEGEPTAGWGIFSRAVLYFRKACSSAGVSGWVGLSTNGVFPSSRADFLATNIDRITVSLDGVASVNNQNRVLPNGKGSFDLVVANLKRLAALGTVCDIRSTVSATSVDQMEDFAHFVGQNLRAKSIHFEPVFDVTGVTQLRGEIRHPAAETFVDGFRKARRVAAQYGIELYYSGSVLGLRDGFCGVSGARSFLVTTRGIVSSCTEVLQESDPRAGVFQYGRWDESTGRFSINQERVSRLRGLYVDDIPKCHGCLAKHNCAGDCYARSAGASGDPWGADYTYRCYITRELLKDNLVLALLTSELGLGTYVEGGACSFDPMA